MIDLEYPVKFNEFIRPICLPLTSDENIFDYGSATVIGFGKTETKSTSDRLMKAEIDVVDRETCKQRYRTQGISIQEKQICAMKYRVDAW